MTLHAHEENTAFEKHICKAGRPPKYSSPEEMQAKIDAYFVECDSAVPERPYTMAGLALALGFKSRTSLHNYANRNAGHEEFANTIKGAKLRIEVQREIMLVTCTGNPAGLIFDLKNNFGWKENKFEHVSRSGGGPGQLASGLAFMPPKPEDMEKWKALCCSQMPKMETR